MNIVLVSPHFPPRHIGGVEHYVKRLADDLRRDGHIAHVICVESTDRPQHGVEVEHDESLGYPVHRLHLSSDLFEAPISFTYDIPVIEPIVADILRASEADVMHLHSGYLLGGSVLKAAREIHVPVVVTLHDFWFICPLITMIHPGGTPCSGPESSAKCAWCLSTLKRRYRMPDQWTRGRVSRLVAHAANSRSTSRIAQGFAKTRRVQERHRVLGQMLSRADLILSPSNFVRDRVVETGIDATQISISRYGIDVRGVSRPEQRVGGPLRVGYLGQLAPHKGVHLLIEAARQLTHDISVTIFGDPVPHPGYVTRLRRAAGTDPRINFAGPYRHENVYEVLSRLDVIVVPSTWYENSPFVIQEAQAAHVPVIASRLGGMRELVRDEHDGLLFEAGNAADLARQIRRLVEHPALLQQLRPDGSNIRPANDELLELRGHYARLSASRRKASVGEH